MWSKTGTWQIALNVCYEAAGKHIILPHYCDREVTCDNCDVLNFIDITNLVLWTEVSQDTEFVNVRHL
jgi:hypothetical protein